ncbi:phosphate/phosphite/phosphonate ABC transporter substrate-binding protein [Ramlibacter tataouinensis]|uniref:Uncharacterized protein n=1 Tax=Ramlibacter tataouinensis (strain ATCC BAA-407 / DSM 14655 / LMG 21543 / TTB310) TaxID=365046 RepID=F5XYF3_RAMTT|nr:PhnD/SsuA/transferrin family substrate-binding protein [Ramlibacter tataouinensis]AEG93129.1 hypothetical protein Rta_20360 [Ramlibacter tataouinensis TTB310]
MKRRTLCSWSLGALLAPMSWAQQTNGAVRKPGPNWRLLINEAVTGETNIFVLTNRYQGLADYISAQPKGRAIGIEPVVDIRRFMSLAQGGSKPDLVFGKSVNQMAKLVRDSGYQPVVRRSDEYKAAFIVGKGVNVKSLAEVKGEKIIMPDEYAATTAVAKAELRRQNVTNPRIIHVRYQEAVAQQVQAGLADVGVVNPSTAKKWAEQGGRVLAETRPVANWSLLASPSMPAEEVNALRDALIGMNKQAPTVLASLGFKEWARADRKEYLELLDYTKE